MLSFYYYSFVYFRHINSYCYHYRVFDYKKLPELTKDGSLSYNAHYVNYNAMFIRLSSRCSIHIELFADYVEYEWIC